MSNSSSHDLGLVAAAVAAIGGLAVYALSRYELQFLLGGNIAFAAAVAVVLGVISAVVSHLLLANSGAMAHFAAALALAVVAYGSIAWITHWVQLAAYREAQTSAKSYSWVSNISFARTPIATSTGKSAFGVTQVGTQSGYLLLSLSSTKPATLLQAPGNTTTPVLKPALVEARIKYLAGPSDGDCSIIFGFTMSEHWFSFDFGPEGLRVTQDAGSPIHVKEFGPVHSRYAQLSRWNTLAVSQTASSNEFFVNGHLIASERSSILPVPPGSIYLAAQAKSDSDLVACAISDVRIRGIANTPPN